MSHQQRTKPKDSLNQVQHVFQFTAIKSIGVNYPLHLPPGFLCRKICMTFSHTDALNKSAFIATMKHELK